MIPMSIQLPKEPQRIWELPVPILREGNLIRAYLTDDISAPFDYNELCYALETATADDTIRLYINTPGGVIDSATMLVDAMRNSPATIIGYLSGGVYSAGTMISLNCDDLVVAPHCSFMVHTFSTSVSGKGSDLSNFTKHADKGIKELVTETYAGFLTKPEMTKVLKGEELWFNAPETRTRWENRKLYLQEAANA